MTPEEIRERWPASEDCSCIECVGYCRRPGWFLPDEIRALAGHLGLTLQETFNRYLVLDWWGEGEEIDHHVGVLSPGKHDETGDIASIGFVTSPGACIFLNGGKCSIHAVKPHECRAAHHTNEAASPVHLETAKAWGTEEGRALVREVGYDPDDLPVPEGSIFDMFDLLLGGRR